jgi:hypothetical protein
VEEITDEPFYRDRVCGIDIGKAQLLATIRVPPDEGRSRRMQETRTFGTTRRDVLALTDWLRSWQVPAVVMEATGDYWKPVFLPAGGRGAGVRAGPCPSGQEPARPAQAGHVRLPVASAELRAGCGPVLLCGHSRVPGDPAAHPLPPGAAGGADPGEAARGKAPGVRGDQAVRCAVRHPWGVRAGHHGSSDHRGAGSPGAGPAGPHPRQGQDSPAGAGPGRDRVLHGPARRAAQDVLAGTGPDMGRFPTAAHLVSWAGRAPLDHQSGQRKGRGKRKKDNRYTGAATGETSVSAGRTHTREGARYRRLARRIGKNKAQVALSGTQLKVYRKLLSSPGMRYQDPRRRLLRQARPGQAQGQALPRRTRRPRLRRHHHSQAQRRRRRNRAGPSRLTQSPGSRLTAQLLPAAAACPG